MMMMQRKLDEKLGCANARAALPTAGGTDRRAGNWHRCPHRVRLVTALKPFLVNIYSICALCLVLRCVFSIQEFVLSNLKLAHIQCFTILWQQPGVQALQVRNTHGEWVDAPPIPGTLVIKYVLSSLYLGAVFNMSFVG